jgi:hypothetical protein
MRREAERIAPSPPEDDRPCRLDRGEVEFRVQIDGGDAELLVEASDVILDRLGDTGLVTVAEYEDRTHQIFASTSSRRHRSAIRAAERP